MKIAVSWSSGKDSLLALARALDEGHEVVSLLTALREDDRVSVHGVARSLLREQSDRLGIPLKEVRIGEDVPYEEAHRKAFEDLRGEGVESVAYGDLFLEDIREWRDAFHQRAGLPCFYPIWGSDTRALAEAFIASGHRAVVVCVDTRRLEIEFAGRDYDQAFLRDLPESVDPCGENGEFHTFVYGGPLFEGEISFGRAPVVEREFTDPGHAFSFGFRELASKTEQRKELL